MYYLCLPDVDLLSPEVRMGIAALRDSKDDSSESSVNIFRIKKQWKGSQESILLSLPCFRLPGSTAFYNYSELANANFSLISTLFLGFWANGL